MVERRLKDWPVVINDMTYFHESEERFGSCTYNLGEFESKSGRKVVYLSQQRKTDEFVSISEHPRGGDFRREQGVTVAGYATRDRLKKKIELVPGEEIEEVKNELLEHYNNNGWKTPSFVEFW